MFPNYGTDPKFVCIERDLSPEEMAAIALAAGADDADCTTDYDAEVTARKACESDEEWSEAARLGAIRLAKRVFSLRCSACGTLTVLRRGSLGLQAEEEAPLPGRLS